MSELKPKKIIHRGWQEYQDSIKDKINIDPIFEKYQYHYFKGDIIISLVQFVDGVYKYNDWEIYQIKGKQKLFEDIEKFTSKEKAEIRIKELFSLK